MLLTFLESSAAIILLVLCLAYFVVVVARLLGARTFEVFFLATLVLFTALASPQGHPTQLSGVFSMIFFGYMLIIRDKLATARKARAHHP
jgi:hypothetical protein